MTFGFPEADPRSAAGDAELKAQVGGEGAVFGVPTDGQLGVADRHGHLRASEALVAGWQDAARSGQSREEPRRVA